MVERKKPTLLKRLYNQLKKYQNNPDMCKKIENKIRTLEKRK